MLTEHDVRAILAGKRLEDDGPPLLNSTEVRAIRGQLAMTQPQMASALGVDLRTYQRWEHGAITKPGSMALRLIKEARL